MTLLLIYRLAPLNEGLLTHLVVESRSQGFRFVERLLRDYQRGVQCFDQPGDLLLAVSMDGRVIGIGGLTVDPYFEDARVGRLRHVYIESAYRGPIHYAKVVGTGAELRLWQQVARLRVNGAAPSFLAKGFSIRVHHRLCGQEIPPVEQSIAPLDGPMAVLGSDFSVQTCGAVISIPPAVKPFHRSHRATVWPYKSATSTAKPRWSR